MSTTKYLLLSLALIFGLLTPAFARAAALTEPQIQAILNLLIAFEVDSETVGTVSAILHAPAISEGQVLGASTDTLSCSMSINGQSVMPEKQFSFTKGELLSVSWVSTNADVVYWFGQTNLESVATSGSKTIDTATAKEPTILVLLYVQNSTQKSGCGARVSLVGDFAKTQVQSVPTATSSETTSDTSATAAVTAQKDEVLLKFKGKQLPVVPAVSKSVAQNLCGLVKNHAKNKYFTNSSCVRNGEKLSFVSASAKEGSPLIKFGNPRAGKNDYISISGTYAVEVKDSTAPAQPENKYRMYLSRYDLSDRSEPKEIYQANLTSAQVSGERVTFMWDFTVDTTTTKIPPGAYSISIYNLESGSWGTVSAFTFLTEPKSVQSQPTVAVAPSGVWSNAALATIEDLSSLTASVGEILVSPYEILVDVCTDMFVALGVGR